MDIQQLLTFQKLAKEQSFKRASQELGISQPTVTMRIKALESEMGETLILRTGQKSALTPAGELFLSYVDRALKIFQSGKDRIAEGEGEGSLTIAGTPTFNTYVLPGMLSGFAKSDGNVRWRIYTETSDCIVQMIVDGVVDIGFIRGTVSIPNVHVFRLYSEELALVVRHDHPLSSLQSIAIRELKNEPLILYLRQSETWRLIEQRFRSEGLTPKVTMELTHVVAVKQMAIAGLGLGFLPEIVVADEIRSGLLNKIPLDGPPLILQTSIVIPNKSPSPQVAAFIRFLYQRFPSAEVTPELALWLE